MTRRAYRAMTFASLALLAISATQKDWLGELFGSPLTAMQVSDKVSVTFQLNWGNTILALLSIGLAYLWLSSKNSN